MTDLELRRVKPRDEDRRDYEVLTRECGFVDFSGRTQLELRGEDRQRFLHNLCTNDIQRLKPQQGCEAFVTKVNGKCLGHVFVFVTEASLIVESSPDQAATLLPHLDRYHITEDVELIDRSQDWGELLVAGPQAVSWIARLTDGDRLAVMYSHRAIRCDGIAAWVRRVPLTSEPSYLVAAARADLSAVEECLRSHGVRACTAAAFHMARIEAGFPWYGWDITDRNLPQEVNRNEAAISFTKGCYLGQETVARIDALGHVNRLAVALRCDAPEAPDAGTPLKFDQEIVGEVTSSADSPRLGAPLALAYVRCPHADPGTTLTLPDATATVVRLPVGRAEG
jgi:folate-binding protein YgfZ